jgi:hypothetical protein
MSAYIKRTERSQINKLMLHLKLLVKQEQAKPETSRRREIIKIRAENNEIETKNKTYKESTKQKAGSLKKQTRLTTPGKSTKIRKKRHKLVKPEMKKGR